MNIILAGISSNYGALLPGTEKAPSLLRQAGLVKTLGDTFHVKDLGDLKMPDNLSRHDQPPIRNWPAPQMVWDATRSLASKWFESDSFTLILGGGCSTFTGIGAYWLDRYCDNAHILSIDHHIDAWQPNATLCRGATSNTLWFLTHANPWLKSALVYPMSHVAVMGYDEETVTSEHDINGMDLYTRQALVQAGIPNTAHHYLKALPQNAKVILHLDLDVLAETYIESVYAPSPAGLSPDDLKSLLVSLLKDRRIEGLMVTEFSGNTAAADQDAENVVNWLCDSLKASLPH
ncbi:MAG: arginase [Clostridiales bacterium]|jgi:arginase family enzyme|nr:arginase [Clostridiales bacterium]